MIGVDWVLGFILSFLGRIAQASQMFIFLRQQHVGGRQLLPHFMPLNRVVYRTAEIAQGDL
jgi:hypothetical protein